MVALFRRFSLFLSSLWHLRKSCFSYDRQILLNIILTELIGSVRADISSMCSIGHFGLSADLRQCSDLGAGLAWIADAHGPEPTLATTSK